MRKVTQEIVWAFRNRRKLTVGNTHTDGRSIFLHGNEIAKWDNDGDLLITNAGWSSNTTKERLNGLPSVSISQRDYVWYLNGMKWDGEWVRVTDYGYAEILPNEVPEDQGADNLKTVAMVAALGSVLCQDQKSANDWKARMLKAGLEGSGLIMPEDWDGLSEDEKERRLDGAIGELK